MTSLSVRFPASVAWVVGIALGACTHPEGTGLGGLPGGSGNDTMGLPKQGIGGGATVPGGGASGGTGEGPPAVVVDGNIMGGPPPMVQVCEPAVYTDKYTPGQNVPAAPSDAEVQSLLNL